MTEEQRKRFGLCERWRGCSASVCPLYDALDKTYFIQGDSRCTRILDYSEGSLEDGELKDEIRRTEPVWKIVLGGNLLTKWMEGRIKAREYFKKTGEVGTAESVTERRAVG